MTESTKGFARLGKYEGYSFLSIRYEELQITLKSNLHAVLPLGYLCKYLDQRPQSVTSAGNLYSKPGPLW